VPIGDLVFANVIDTASRAAQGDLARHRERPLAPRTALLDVVRS
jgi:hypothetical protein